MYNFLAIEKILHNPIDTNASVIHKGLNSNASNGHTMQNVIDHLKSNGFYEAAGALAAATNEDRFYGCHYGMKSNLDLCRNAFYRGYDSVKVN
jgi:hypothetical protein